MKYIIIILSLMLFISSELLANSFVGKGLNCGKNLYVYFHSEDFYHSYDYDDYEIKYFTYPYSSNPSNIILYTSEVVSSFRINRKTLEWYRSGSKQSSICSVFNSKKELISEMNKIIEKAKSENKL